jgi:hypothetical protein
MATADTRVKQERGQEEVVRAGPALATGVIAGVVGGIGFGVLMQTEGMLPVVASLAGGRTSSLGWIVHMVIAVFVGVSFAIIGISFAIFFARVATGFLSSTLFGLFYGAFWWVLGGLFLMPVWLGTKAFVIDETAWKSLVGHLIYGLLLGAVYGVVSPLLSRRRSEPGSSRRD